jgi:hypothetical protein
VRSTDLDVALARTAGLPYREEGFGVQLDSFGHWKPPGVGSRQRLSLEILRNPRFDEWGMEVNAFL